MSRMIGVVSRVASQQSRGARRDHFVWGHTFIARSFFAIMLLSCATLLCAAALAVTVGGPFTLTAPDGRTVTDRDFPGRWLLVYFGYTSCPDSCPTALADMAKTLERLGADAERVQPIFITLDPRRDTREVLGSYARSFSSRIVALTGSPEQIDPVAHAYGAYALPHGGDPARSEGLLDHSVYIYVMDPDGRFVRAFDPSWTPDDMAKALRQTMRREPKQDRSQLIAKP